MRSRAPRSPGSRTGRARRSRQTSRPTAGSSPSSPTDLDSLTSGSASWAPGAFANLTPGLPPMVTSGNILRTLGFNGDGSEVWFSPSGNPAAPKVLVPLTGGTPRPFLAQGNSTPAWSPQDTQVAYIVATAPGDPLFIADRTGANPVRSSSSNGPATGRPAHAQSGVVSRRSVDLLRARDRTDRQDGHLAHATRQVNRLSSSPTSTRT